MTTNLLIDLPETITSPRLILQMPKAHFGAQVHEAICDGYEDNIKWLAWSPIIPTVEAVEEDCRKHHAEFILRTLIRYIIIEKATGIVIGRTAFPPVYAHWQVPQFGISYFIRRSKRQQGYATEATHVMALLAFRVLAARKVEIYCEAENLASSKIPEKLNFTFEFSQKGAWLSHTGDLAQLNAYSIFSENDLPPLDITW